MIPIDKGVEFTVCGPHLLLRKDDEKIVAKSVDEVGIEFIRIEFDTLKWYYKVSMKINIEFFKIISEMFCAVSS